MNNTRTAFVTGGTGFLGINLIQQLVANGWEVTALHRSSSNLTNLKTLDIKFKVGSLHDVDSLEKAMPQGVDAVFHVAGNVNFWSLKNAVQTKDNVDGTRNMVSTALKLKARRFIHTSTIGTYGFHSEIITEQTPSTASHSWINYVRSKWLAEEEVRKGINQGLDAVIINPCNIIGPYDYNNWSQMFKGIHDRKLPGVPSGAGSFCHVREVAKAHITAFEKGKSGSNYICAGADATYGEMVQLMSQLLGHEKPPKVLSSFLLRIIGRLSLWVSYLTRKEPDLTPEMVYMLTNRIVASSEKAEKELGYQAVPLKLMLEDCYHWMKKEGLLAI